MPTPQNGAVSIVNSYQSITVLHRIRNGEGDKAAFITHGITFYDGLIHIIGISAVRFPEHSGTHRGTDRFTAAALNGSIELIGSGAGHNIAVGSTAFAKIFGRIGNDDYIASIKNIGILNRTNRYYAASHGLSSHCAVVVDHSYL